MAKTLKLPVVLQVGDNGNAERMAVLAIPTDITTSEVLRINAVLLAVANRAAQ